MLLLVLLLSSSSSLVSYLLLLLLMMRYVMVCFGITNGVRTSVTVAAAATCTTRNVRIVTVVDATYTTSDGKRNYNADHNNYKNISVNINI